MDRTTRLRHLALLTMAVAGAGWLAACTTAPGVSQPVPAPVPQPAASASAPAPAPVSAPAPPAVDPSLPVSPAAAQQAQRQAVVAIELLEVGSEDQALVEIEKALHSDPANKLAQSLLRQVQTDPQVLLGHEYFNYRVEPGESLSRIAGRFLKDIHLFYALARYNDIRIPRQLQGGQMIKVPGKQPPAPPPPPPPAPAPAPAPARPAPEHRAQTDAVVIAQEYRRGLSLMAQQKPSEAIKAFDLVLERDPSHANAKLKRAQALNQVSGLIRLLENTIKRLDAQLAQNPNNAAAREQRDKAVADRDRLLTVQ